MKCSKLLLDRWLSSKDMWFDNWKQHTHTQSKYISTLTASGVQQNVGMWHREFL